MQDRSPAVSPELLNSYGLLIISGLNALYKTGEDFNKFQAFNISHPCGEKLFVFPLIF